MEVCDNRGLYTLKIRISSQSRKLPALGWLPLWISDCNTLGGFFVLDLNNAATIYVCAEYGNDYACGLRKTETGDLQGPLKTLDAALELVRQLRIVCECTGLLAFVKGAGKA